jgi:ferredoxin/flavodoxin---NADP+ reductase
MDLSHFEQIELRRRVDFSDDLAVFQFELEEPLSFTPGQYATVGLIGDGNERPILRPYSVVSAPHEPALELFVELVEGGALTSHLWDANLGDTFWIRRKIVGRFVLDDTTHQHVMVATVTGVSPYISIVRDQVRALERGALDTPHEILILHGASRSWELGTYLDELREISAAHDWLTYVPTVSRPWEDPDWTGEVGRVEDVIRKHVDRVGFAPESAAAYTCGHPEMIDKAQGIFQRARFSEDAIREEKYFVVRN